MARDELTVFGWSTGWSIGASDRVLVTAPCWYCGGQLSKLVSRRNLSYRFLTWGCQDCDVYWTGPGQLRPEWQPG